MAIQADVDVTMDAIVVDATAVATIADVIVADVPIDYFKLFKIIC